MSCFKVYQESRVFSVKIILEKTESWCLRVKYYTKTHSTIRMCTLPPFVHIDPKKFKGQNHPDTTRNLFTLPLMFSVLSHTHLILKMIFGFDLKWSWCKMALDKKRQVNIQEFTKRKKFKTFQKFWVLFLTFLFDYIWKTSQNFFIRFIILWKLPSETLDLFFLFSLWQSIPETPFFSVLSASENTSLRL